MTSNRGCAEDLRDGIGVQILEADGQRGAGCQLRIIGKRRVQCRSVGALILDSAVLIGNKPRTGIAVVGQSLEHELTKRSDAQERAGGDAWPLPPVARIGSRQSPPGRFRVSEQAFSGLGDGRMIGILPHWPEDRGRENAPVEWSQVDNPGGIFV